MSHCICLSGGVYVSLKQHVAWVQRERSGKGMITALSEETGFIANVNQESSCFLDFCNYCNITVTLL